MLFLGATQPLTGWPSVLLAVVVAGALAGGAFALARRSRLLERLFLVRGLGAGAPSPSDRLRQLVACADYGADYGLTALPDFPPCAHDPVLARAARLAVEHPHPDDLAAVLDADLRDWISSRVKAGILVRRSEALLSGIGVLGLLFGLLGAGAFAGGWLPSGPWAPAAVFLAILGGMLATALGSARAGRRAIADPAMILDRQIIGAAMVALRQAKGPREIETILSGFVPSSASTDAAARSRAA